MRRGQAPSDTSTLINLREIMDLEQDRIREEREARARAAAAADEAARLKEARAQAERDRALAEETARLAAAARERERSLAAAAEAAREHALRLELDARHRARAEEHERLLAHERGLALREIERRNSARGPVLGAVVGTTLACLVIGFGAYAALIAPEMGRMAIDNAALRGELSALQERVRVHENTAATRPEAAHASIGDQAVPARTPPAAASPAPATELRSSGGKTRRPTTAPALEFNGDGILPDE
jgi:colicin import membrane protein